MFILKVFTGPASTSSMAEKCRQAGITGITLGTEHVYPQVEATDPKNAPGRFLDLLKRHHGTDFGLGSYPVPIRVLPLRRPT